MEIVTGSNTSGQSANFRFSASNYIHISSNEPKYHQDVKVCRLRFHFVFIGIATEQLVNIKEGLLPWITDLVIMIEDRRNRMSIAGQNGPQPFPMVMEPDLSGTKFLERTTGSTAPLCPSDKMGSIDHHWENNNGIFRKSSLFRYYYCSLTVP